MLHASYEQSHWYPDLTGQSNSWNGTTLVSRPRTRPTTFGSDTHCDPTLNGLVEFTTDNVSPTRAARSDLATVLSDLEHFLHQTTFDVVASFETALHEPAVTSNKERASSVMKRVMAGPTVTRASKETGTLVESVSDTTNYKLQPPSTSVARLLSNITSEIEPVWADLGILLKTNVEAIVENSLTKWKSTLQLQIFKAVESTFKRPLPGSYFDSNNSLKSSMLCPYGIWCQDAQPRSEKICSPHECQVSCVQHRIPLSDLQELWKYGGQSGQWVPPCWHVRSVHESCWRRTIDRALAVLHNEAIWSTIQLWVSWGTPW